MRRGHINVTCELIEGMLFGGCEIIGASFNATRRILTFQLRGDQFDEVPDGNDSYNYSVIHELDGEVRFEK